PGGSRMGRQVAPDQLDLFKNNRKVTKRLGRPPTGKRRDPRHRTRPEVNRHHPQHVTLRVVDGVGWLRRMDMYKAIRRAMHAALRRADFRCVHASIQGNHIHLVCEAENRRALSRGVQGAKISMAYWIKAALRKRE